MRTKLLVASCGILILFGAHQSSAEHLSPPFLKLCEAADGDTVGSSSSDAPGTDPETQKAQSKPARSAEDIALTERLQNLIASKLQQYVTRPEDRTAVEAFYRERDFVPVWVNASGALPNTRKAIDFLHAVATDGLDPKDYATPTLPTLIQRGWLRTSLR